MIRRTLPTTAFIALSVGLSLGCSSPDSRAPRLGNGPVVTSDDTAESRFGRLLVTRVEDPAADRTSDLRFDGSILQFGEGRFAPATFSVVRAFEFGSSDLFLVRGDTGAATCPLVWLIVEASGRGAKVTDPFGTCSDLIQAEPRAGKLAVTLYEGPRDGRVDQTATFIYENGTVRPTPNA